MFNSDFFPTPPDVIDTMLSGIDIKNKTILEPSAGKGDIVKALNMLGAASVLTCESNNDLAQILQPISDFIEPDFMKVTKNRVSHIHSIIMNPPFSKGVDHIMHAWKIAPEGCQIVALCNYQTIENKHTRLRGQLGQVIKENGISENIGAVFNNAERTTGIDIGLIRLFKPVVSGENRFEGFYTDEEPEENNGNGIMPFNEVRNVVQSYIGTVEAFEQLEKQSEVVNRYIKPLGLSDGFSYAIGYDSKVTTVDAFAKALQKRSWEYIINKSGVKKFVTSGVMEDINKFVEQQTQYPFTMKNIYKMLQIIVATRSQTMDRAAIEVFDKITLHHHENRHMVEGWKTNKHWFVGKKFILDYTVDVTYHGGMDFKYNSHGSTRMDDFNKVLCYIIGQHNKIPSLYQFKNYTHYENAYDKDGQPCERLVKREEPIYFNTWYDWGFFQIKGFKKGTLHVKFKHREVWARFNQKVAEIKGYPLPEKF